MKGTGYKAAPGGKGGGSFKNNGQKAGHKNLIRKEKPGDMGVDGKIRKVTQKLFLSRGKSGHITGKY